VTTDSRARFNGKYNPARGVRAAVIHMEAPVVTEGDRPVDFVPLAISPFSPHGQPERRNARHNSQRPER